MMQDNAASCLSGLFQDGILQKETYQMFGNYTEVFTYQEASTNNFSASRCPNMWDSSQATASRRMLEERKTKTKRSFLMFPAWLLLCRKLSFNNTFPIIFTRSFEWIRGPYIVRHWRELWILVSLTFGIVFYSTFFYLHCNYQVAINFSKLLT